MDHRLLVLTDRSQTGGRALVDVVRGAVAGGARVVVMREKDLPPRERAQLAAQLAAVLHDVDGTLLAASTPTADTDGVHLAAADSFPTSPPPIVGRSCHHDADLRRAANERCDYATLSPIFASASKSGYGPALGPRRLADSPLPVFGLGGVDTSNARRCVAAGSWGVAVMGAVMRAPDPAVVVAQMLDRLTAGAPT